MCGIVGSLVLGHNGYTSVHSGIQKSMLLSSVLRGIDGTGVACGSLSDPNKIFVMKEAKPATDIIDKKVMSMLTDDSRWLIAHCRAATVGALTDEACHPFHEGDVCGVHNGTVGGIESKLPSIGGVNDSQIIYKALAAAEPEQATEVIRKLDPGAYALSWFDKRINSLRFARNHQRPMWLYKHGNMWVWASEPGIIASSIARELQSPLKYMEIKPRQLDVHRVLTIPLDGSAASVEEYEPAWHSRPTRQTASTFHQGEGRWNRVCSATFDKDDDYALWWATDKDEEDDPVGMPPVGLNQNEYEEGWVTIKSSLDIWNAPQWLAPYKVNLFKGLRWALNLGEGSVPACTKDEFKEDLQVLASHMGNDEETRRIAFTGLSVNQMSGMVYGAATSDASRTFPVVGMLSTTQLEVYNCGAAIVKDGGKDVVPVFSGEITALNAYCDGTMGIRVDNLSLSSWDDAASVTPDEVSHGSSDTHPHILAVRFPEMIDWRNWR